MATEIWATAFTSLGQSFGLTGGAMATLFVFVVSIGVSIAVAIALDKNDHKKQIGIVSFYSMLFLFTLLGALDWIILLLSLVISIGVYGYTYKRGND